MNRARAFVFLALASAGFVGCSAIVNGKLQERVASCDGRPNGTPCLGADYCVASACVFASCGDGVVTTGEVCDDGNANSFDGCTTFCTLTCTASADCDDGQVCNGNEVCTAQHACVSGQPATNGTTCSPAAGGTGACDGAGFCVSSGCGDGTVDTNAGEECEPPSSLGCRADCRFVCTSNFDCPTADPCTDNQQCNTASHVCEAVGPLVCDDGDPCSADYCATGLGCASDIIDGDSDGFAPLPALEGACSSNSAYGGGDCDDTRDDTHPGAIDLCADGIDQDCNGTADDGGAINCYRDEDGDSFGDPNSAMTANCSCPSGYVPDVNGADCDDLNRGIRPNYPGEGTRWTDVPFCAGKADVIDYGDGVFGCSDSSNPVWDVDCDATVDIETKDVAGECRVSLLSQMCEGAGFSRGSVPDCGISADYAGCERSCGPLICTCQTYATKVTQRCH